MTDSRPEPSEYGAFYAGYVSKVPESQVIPVLESQLEMVPRFWSSIPESSASIVHAPYTWNVRQVMDHLVDGERIFGYRLFRIARGDSTPLPGFDENQYAMASEERPSPLSEIIHSFQALRTANLIVLRNLPDAAWCRVGTASGYGISVRALAWILAGHIRHHDRILRERLGVPTAS